MEHRSLICWLLTKVPLALPMSTSVNRPFSPTELGVAARHLGVVQADGIAGVAADRDDALGQLELLAFVGAFDDQQSRQSPTPR